MRFVVVLFGCWIVCLWEFTDGAMRTTIRFSLVVLIACATVACGSPTGPTPPTGPPPCTAPPAATPAGEGATLAVLVMSQVRTAPIGCVSVRLEPIAGGSASTALEATTGSDGRAVWRVVPNQRYSIHVRNQLAITAALLEGDAQWLVSLPE